MHHNKAILTVCLLDTGYNIYKLDLFSVVRYCIRYNRSNTSYSIYL